MAIKIEPGGDNYFLVNGQRKVKSLYEPTYQGNTVTITNVITGRTIVPPTDVTDILDENDTEYASVAAFKTVTDGFFF